MEKTKQILKLPLKNLFLNFPLNGLPPLHDKIRGLPRSFQKTWSTYQKILALSKKEPRLSINIETTISAYNINHLKSFLKKLTKNGHQVTITLAHTGYLYKSTPTNKKFTQLEQSKKKIKKITNLIKKNLAFTSPLGLIQRLYLDKMPSFPKKAKK